MLFSLLFWHFLRSCEAFNQVRSSKYGQGRERERESEREKGNRKVSVEKRLVPVAREVGVGMSQPR
jgi:hypothetical protein